MEKSSKIYFPNSDQITKDWSKVHVLYKIKFCPWREVDEAFAEAAREFKEHYGNIEIGHSGGDGYIRIFKPIKEQFLLRMPNGFPMPLELMGNVFEDRDQNEREVDTLMIEMQKLTDRLSATRDFGEKLDLRRQIRKLKDAIKHLL